MQQEKTPRRRRRQPSLVRKGWKRKQNVSGGLICKGFLANHTDACLPRLLVQPANTNAVKAPSYWCLRVPFLHVEGAMAMLCWNLAHATTRRLVQYGGSVVVGERATLYWIATDRGLTGNAAAQSRNPHQCLCLNHTRLITVQIHLKIIPILRSRQGLFPSKLTASPHPHPHPHPSTDSCSQPEQASSTLSVFRVCTGVLRLVTSLRIIGA